MNLENYQPTEEWTYFDLKKEIEEQMELYRLYMSQGKYIEAELVLRLCANIQANLLTPCFIINTAST